MILCICPTSTIERNWITPNFSIGGFYRVQEEHIFASGKGVNVARVIRKLGGEVMCTGLVGGFNGRHFLELLKKEDIPGFWTQIAGETRLSITVIDPEHDRDATSICHYGPHIEPKEWSSFVASLKQRAGTTAKASEHVCISGSIPPSIGTARFFELVQDLSRTNKIWLDASGPMLKAGVQARPFAIKVNAREISDLLERPVQTTLDALSAARSVRDAYEISVVAITLGPAGAVCSSIFGNWLIHPISYPRITSSIGSGDAFMGGLLSSFDRGEPFDRCLQSALAASGANTQTLGPGTFDIEVYRQAFETAMIEEINHGFHQ